MVAGAGTFTHIPTHSDTRNDGLGAFVSRVTAFLDEADGDRTRNLRIDSPML